MRTLILAAAALLLSACGTTGGIFNPPPDLPTDGPIAYACANGAQLSVEYENNSARVAIVGGPSMVLPNTGNAEAPYYYNGRYGLRGSGASATWQTPGGAPTNCRGR